MSRRTIWISASFLLAFALLVVLFRIFEAQPKSVLDLAISVPLSTLLFVTSLTFANKIVGALKWRISLRALSPDAMEIPIFEMSEATAWGTFIGQFLPPQISAATARWAYLRRTHHAGAVVGSTLFEQLFDLFVLVAAAIAGVAVIGFGFQGATATMYFVICAAAALAALRISLSAIDATLRRRATGRFGALADAVSRTRSLSPLILLQLTALSTVRLVLVATRAWLIVMAILPEIDSAVIALGYPITGLAMAIPIVPAGIGAAEWTWTGLMVLAGAAAATAASASVAVRLVNMVGLAIVLAGFQVWRLFRRMV